MTKTSASPSHPAANLWLSADVQKNVPPPVSPTAENETSRLAADTSNASFLRAGHASIGLRDLSSSATEPESDKKTKSTAGSLTRVADNFPLIDSLGYDLSSPSTRATDV